MTEGPDDLPAEEDAKPFLEHLEELRWTILFSLLALAVGMGIAAFLAPNLLHLLTLPLSDIGKDPTAFLRSLKVAGAIGVILKIAAWGGLLLSMPVILWFTGKFIFPGLTGREKTILLRACAFSVVLFAFGIFLGYFFCLPIALRFMLTTHAWIGVTPEWTVNDYVAFTMQLLIGFGLAFQMPLLLLVLGKLGLVNVQQLRAKRPHAAITCLVVGMLLTPQDVASLFWPCPSMFSLNSA